MKETIEQGLKEADEAVALLHQAILEENRTTELLELALALGRTLSIKEAFKILQKVNDEQTGIPDN